MEAPIDVVQYLRKDQIAPTQRIFIDYFRDIIKMYGVSAIYFKQNTPFPAVVYENFQNLIYDEHIPTYDTSAVIPLYLETNTDAFMLTKFGIEPDQKYTAYFMIKDFEFAFAALAEQHWVTGNTTAIVNISGGYGTLSSEFVSEDKFLSGEISSTIHIPLTGEVDGIASGQFNQYDSFIYTNPDIYWHNTWDYIKTTFSSFHGPYTGTLDENGNGTVSANIRGIIMYKRISDLERNIYKKVKPLPKDYFVIPFTDENPEEFEISHVISRNLMPNGVNPLLTHYVFACNVQRREYSHEQGLGSTEPSNEQVLDMLEDFKLTKEYKSDELYDYRQEDVDIIDKKYSDRIFGGYGESVTVLPNTPVSAIDIENTVTPTSGIIFNFVFGSSLFTDGEDIYFSQAGHTLGNSILTDNVLDISACSGNYTKVRYLVSDSNKVYFVNLSGISAEIPMDIVDNQYLRETMEINGVFTTTAQFYEPSGIVLKFPDSKSSIYSDGVGLLYINRYQRIFDMA